jgi:hypothetical protein
MCLGKSVSVRIGWEARELAGAFVIFGNCGEGKYSVSAGNCVPVAHTVTRLSEVSELDC